MADDDEHDDATEVVARDPTGRQTDYVFYTYSSFKGRFERYKKCLGTGAYKKVFLAFDQEDGVEVAWNTLRIDTRHDAQRILGEVHL